MWAWGTRVEEEAGVCFNWILKFLDWRSLCKSDVEAGWSSVVQLSVAAVGPGFDSTSQGATWEMERE